MAAQSCSPFRAHVSNRDDRDQRILSAGRHGGVEPRRSVDIKTGIGRQAEVTNDALEILTIIIRKEKRMRREHLIGLIDSPEETDHRTGESFAGQGLDHAVLRQKVLIYVGQVGIGKHHIRLEMFIHLKQHAACMR